jgi:hypothetical protein
MSSQVEMRDATPIMCNDEEAVENAEGKRRRNEEVYRSNRLAMIIQKSGTLTRRFGTSRSFSHPAQHGTLGDVEAEHLQLTVNARRAPSAIFGDRVKDELTQSPADTSSSTAVARPKKPRPVHLETGSMPANHGLRLNENQ